MGIKNLSVNSLSSIKNWHSMIESDFFRKIVNGEIDLMELANYFEGEPLGCDMEAWLRKLVFDVRRISVNKSLNMLEYFETLGISNLQFGIPEIIKTYVHLVSNREVIFTNGLIERDSQNTILSTRCNRRVENCDWIIRVSDGKEGAKKSAIINTFAIRKIEIPFSTDLDSIPTYYHVSKPGYVKMLLRSETK